MKAAAAALGTLGVVLVLGFVAALVIVVIFIGRALVPDSPEPSCDQADYYRAQLAQESRKPNPDQQRLDVLSSLAREAQNNC